MSKKIIAICVLASALVSAGVSTLLFKQQKPIVSNLPDFSLLIEKDGPSVVNIRTVQRQVKVKTGSPAEIEAMLKGFFDPTILTPRELDPDRGVGSGFIISRDGYLLTNAHVVNTAEEVIVTLTDQRQFKAKVLGTDERSDIALLKIDSTEDFPFLEVGNSDKIKVGEWVFAIGSPYNLENSVTAGIISATSRDAGEYLPFIQSDVSINPGNSGGPLINIHGKVIGINSQIVTQSGGSAGISFAIPIDAAMRIAAQLKKSGKVTRGSLGISISDASILMLGTAGMKAVQVVGIEANGPAAMAGVQLGDIIVKFNGIPIKQPTELPWRIGSADIGSTATLSVLRGVDQFEIPVKVGKLDDNKIQQSVNIPLD